MFQIPSIKNYFKVSNTSKYTNCFQNSEFQHTEGVKVFDSLKKTWHVPMPLILQRLQIRCVWNISIPKHKQSVFHTITLPSGFLNEHLIIHRLGKQQWLLFCWDLCGRVLISVIFNNSFMVIQKHPEYSGYNTKTESAPSCAGCSFISKFKQV